MVGTLALRTRWRHWPKRADDVTFTGSFDNPATKDILNGVQLMRQNPVVAALPVFRTPANGLVGCCVATRSRLQLSGRSPRSEP